MRTYLKRLRRLRKDHSGAALIEFAFVVTFLIALLLPLVDLGMGFYYKTRVLSAAQAGAQWVFVNLWQGTNTTTQTKIHNAVTGATTLSVTSSATPWTYPNNDITGGTCLGANCDVWLACHCANTDGTTLSDPPSQPVGAFQPKDCRTYLAGNHFCSGAGQIAQPPGAYVTVKAHATYTPLFRFPGFSYVWGPGSGATISFTASSTVRTPN